MVLAKFYNAKHFRLLISKVGLGFISFEAMQHNTETVKKT